jgi:uncharacterized protein involved in exopolysaccharide biosynthesis
VAVSPVARRANVGADAMNRGDLSESDASAHASADAELDFRAIGHALWRRKLWIVGPALAVAVLAFVVVSFMTPRYKSEARVLYDGRESVFLRPEAEKAGDRDRSIDQETITSQVQLVLSRELARQVVKELKLNERPEFDPVLRGINPVRHLLTMIGIAKDPLRSSPEERIFEAYFARLQAYQVEKSRVIAIEFQSQDPELAARAANTIAEAYIQLQQQTKQEQTRAAGQYLAGEIESLRRKVADAEAKAADFRTKSNLFMGSNNSMLSTQQLGELSTQLAGARSQQAEAEAKARLIRDMLQSGKPIEYSDIINSELIRRLNEQRITLRAQLAEQSSTLLGGHPRIKELRAQIADLERQIRGEAERLVRSFENDAKISGARVEQLGKGLDQLKHQAASSNGSDVQLRALEREAKAQRDLLESYLAKYREATARENLGATLGDARIISRAIVSNTPYFPKKLPIVLITSFATLFLAVGFVATNQVLAGSGYSAFARREDESFAADGGPRAGAALDLETPVNPAAERLRAALDARNRDIVLALAPDVQSAATSVVLARALARTARVALVDLAFAAPKLAAISSEPQAPGLAELVRGKAAFGAVMTRDRGSRAVVIGAGQAGDDVAAILASPRLKLALDALTAANDHVVIHGGTIGDIPLERLQTLAQRVILAVPDGAEEEAKEMTQILGEAGFAPTAITTAPSRRAAEAEARPAPQAA